MLGARSSILMFIAIIPTSRCDDLVPKCSGTFVTNVDRVIALTNHNIVRTELQEGFVKDKNKKSYPAAENMYKMRWSCKLEEMAQRLVQGCELPPTTPPTKHALNFKAFPFEPSKPYTKLNDVINTAYGEWNAQSRKLDATNKFDPKIEQLANMLNSATTSVGCSAQLCGDGVLASVACVYDQPALSAGKDIYKVGRPCAQDSDCTAFSPAKCDSKSSLCERLH
uniref:Venom allergen/ancylostoma secreted protein-like 15 n=1 Tax=Heligmosomoides polygyrus bakeri TaxID=375939 RepID=G4XWY3_HELBE|nr:venom allergen/ancylostoma secreted protein-like 15 [Heligmosomoides bakeri]